MHVFFFRGLSTEGEDIARWNFFNFGPLFKNFAKAFGQRDVQFHPVLGMGAGSLLEIAARARAFLENHPVWQDPKARVHFLGHSAGGLVARLVLSQMEEVHPEKVISLMTIATPHRGAELAQRCMDMPQTHRGSHLVLRLFGYDVRKKTDFLTELTPKNVESLFAGKRAPKAVLGSIVCWAPRQEWCLPLRTFYQVPIFRDFRLPSDGVVERESQAFGDFTTEIQLDHFRQVGLFGKRERFHQICDVAKEFFVRSETKV